MPTFRVTADVHSTSLDAVRPVLEATVTKATVSTIPKGLHVEGSMDGDDARQVNRRLLSALRAVERRTRLRARWSAGEVTWRFFDYVLRGEER